MVLLSNQGSCQFPTLGFVVDRYLRAKNFEPQEFWHIDVVLSKAGLDAKFKWDRGNLFDHHLTLVLYEVCIQNPIGTITNIAANPKSKWAPLPLTTVEMQKLGTKYLKMSSDRIMTVAEKLYNGGIISYPRTETNSFSDSFNLIPLIEKQVQDSRWGQYAQNLINGGFCKPRKGGQDDQAHPPIHPVRGDSTLQGEEKRLFEFITQRFLACCSEAAKAHETTVQLNIADETFTLKGLTILERNFLDVYPFEKWSGNHIPEFKLGEKLSPTVLEMTSGFTTKPLMLTEADLIGLMDKSGIGTDATIHEHIKKILERDYANKDDGYFYPTTLGMALVSGYDNMDIEIPLSKPELRSFVPVFNKDGAKHEKDLPRRKIQGPSSNRDYSNVSQSIQQGQRAVLGAS
jgi:DNA topoisomerase-3